MNEMFDSANAVPTSAVVRATTTPAAIRRLRDMRRLLSFASRERLRWGVRLSRVSRRKAAFQSESANLPDAAPNRDALGSERHRVAPRVAGRGPRGSGHTAAGDSTGAAPDRPATHGGRAPRPRAPADGTRQRSVSPAR